MSRSRLIICVLLPFAAGYFLSYLFRTINAVIASDLTAELGLSAADLGLLTSVYFLVFAAAQLPLGALLDRVGPALVQSLLMLLASVGALIFAVSDSFWGLVVGRGLIGLGVAVALMAGVKAIATWFPPGRLAMATGTMVMLGGLGALASTGPAELMVQAIGWRGLFVVLGGLSALAALLVLFTAPDWRSGTSQLHAPRGFAAIYRDRRFWRVAPLCAVGIGTSWSLQGLWAAPWMRDVEGLDRVTIVQHLSVMALALCAGGFLLGMAADRLRRVGVKTESLLVSALGLSMLAQTALILRWPLPSLSLWTIIAAAGAATVLSYALMGEYFPKAMSGRANGALNLLHVGGAFVLQSATGFIVEQWPVTKGTYPAEAHQLAMAIPLALQIAAVGWFAVSRSNSAIESVAESFTAGSAQRLSTPYAVVLSIRRDRARSACRRAATWRIAAIASTSLCVALAAVVIANSGQIDAEARSANLKRLSGPNLADLSRPEWLKLTQSAHPDRHGPTRHMPAVERADHLLSRTLNIQSEH